MSDETRKQEELLRLALEAHSKNTAIWISQQANKQCREQTILGLIMAILAGCTATGLFFLIKTMSTPADALAVALSGGSIFFTFTIAAILFFTFAHQQKKFM